MSAPFDPRSERQTYHRRRGALFALAAAGLVWLAARRAFRVEVAGPSMSPALEPGEWALAVRSRPRRGDIVVLAHPGRPALDVVKRVVLGPGERTPEGRRLGSDEWFVLGDRPAASTDSRHFGPVAGDAIEGRVLLVYWPPNRARLLRGRGADRPGAGPG
jgi:nickel-type superoxide dismutase maturation protease